MYCKVKEVLDETETLLLKSRYKNKFLKKIVKYAGEPVSFLLLGLDDVFRSLKVMLLMCLIITLSFYFIIRLQSSTQEADIDGIYFYTGYVISLLLTIFALPSIFVFGGVKEEDVDSVSSFIDKGVVETVSDVELLEQNFEIIFNSINKRVKFYQLIIGTLWGLYMYYFNLGLIIWVKNGMNPKEELIDTHLFSFVIALFITLLVLFFVLIYRRANDRLVNTIQFACVEAKYNLA